MTEKMFQRKCREDILYYFPDLHYVKIPDAIRSEKRYRFLPPKPYDAYFIYQGKFVALEYKYTKVLTAFSFAHFTQDNALLSVIENGGIAYYCIGIEAKKFKESDREEFEGCYYSGKIRMMIFLDPRVIIKWKKDMLHGKRILKNENSVTMTELWRYSDYIITRGTKWHFDTFFEWLSIPKILEKDKQNPRQEIVVREVKQ